MKLIPYGHQSITEADIEAVTAVLKSDWLTQGPLVTKFEQEVANYCGAKFAVAVCNATSALHLACLALEIKAGDIVWTSPNTFVASANCALYCGAQIDFIDIDSQTYNISIDALAAKLKLAKQQNKLPRLVIPVHFAGQSCNMQEIHKLAKEYNFSVLEDASHAIGGEYQGKKVGCGEYSDCTVFSFHPVKIITTGEGGMVLTNNEALYLKLKMLVTHGITRNPEFMLNKSEGPWYYEQLYLGYNYRLTDLQCALGLSQLQRIDEFVKIRRELVTRYNNLLADLPLRLPTELAENYSAYHLYVVQLQLEKSKADRRNIFDALRANGIGVNVHYFPVYLQPYYKKLGFTKNTCPVAEKYYQAALTLPLYPGLTLEEQDFVVAELKKILK